MATAAERITWDWLITYEPDLLFLELNARAVEGSYDAVERFFAHVVKAGMKELVGWHRRRPARCTDQIERVLRSPDAYMVALRYLYDALPKTE